MLRARIRARSLPEPLILPLRKSTTLTCVVVLNGNVSCGIWAEACKYDFVINAKAELKSNLIYEQIVHALLGTGSCKFMLYPIYWVQHDVRSRGAPT